MHARRLRTRRWFQRDCGRSGAVAVLAAVSLAALLACFAGALDAGYLMLVRTDLQRAADAAALAATGGLAESPKETDRIARQYVRLNVSRTAAVQDRNVRVETGRWNPGERRLVVGETPPDAVRVTVQRPETPIFFASLFRRRGVDIEASAVATYRARDIMLVLDYSGSMNDQNKIGALKDAVSLFLAYLQEAGSQDRVGFAVYSTDALLAQTLTFDLGAVESQVRGRSADGWTNIGKGMELGQEDLLTNGRSRALRMMVLMTDGLANRPLGRDPQQYVRDEARRADASRIPIVTISFGRGADTTLMGEVADLTGGFHFHVEGSVGQQEKQLRDVFQKVAARRPPALVD